MKQTPRIVDRAQFLDKLHLEKRRAERSKTPLSIAVLTFDSAQENPAKSIDLIKSIEGKVRDTDVLGYLSEDSIGMILPDTNGAGAESVVKKVINGYDSPFQSSHVASYPDQIFVRLAAESHDNNSKSDELLFLDNGIRPTAFSLSLKRVIDIIGSITGIVLLSPVLLLAALIIRIDSPGPALFKQKRLGHKGVPFVFYKFRSMRWKADEKIHKEYVEKLITGEASNVNQGDADKPLYKLKDDQRITRVGKFIRKTSIDELPQLFNVLKGDMSLVGPRPPIPYEVQKYKPWYLRRVLEMRPGITGLWQVEGRSRTTFDEMVRLDVRYIRNWSFWLDLKILVKTVKVVLRQSGAL